MQKLRTFLHKFILFLALLKRRFKVTGSFSQHIGSTFFTQILSLLILIVNGAILARWLGPVGKGTQQLVLMAPNLLGLFLGGGLNVANVYFAGSRQLNTATLTTNSIIIAGVATVFAGFVTVGFIVSGWSTLILPNIPVPLIVLAMVGFPAFLLSSYFSAILQGLQQITIVNLISLSRSIFLLGLTILFVIFLNLDVLGSILATLIANIIQLIITGRFLTKAGGKIRCHWDISVTRTTLSFGLRGYVGNLLQFFNYRLDAFILNYFLGSGDVGIYGVSVRLAELLWQLPNAVSFVIFPKAATTERTSMNRFTPRIFRIVLAITSLGAIVLAITGQPIIQFIYSSSFSNAYLPMVILLPGVVLLGGAKVLSNEISGRGYPQYNSINSGLALIFTIVLDILLIPELGIIGASLASTISYTAIFSISVWFYLLVSRKATPTYRAS